MRSRAGRFAWLTVISLIGLLVGAATRPTLVRADPYCESDECRWGFVCHDAGNQKTGCDIGGAGGCITYGCDET